MSSTGGESHGEEEKGRGGEMNGVSTGREAAKLDGRRRTREAEGGRGQGEGGHTEAVEEIEDWDLVPGIARVLFGPGCAVTQESRSQHRIR